MKRLSFLTMSSDHVLIGHLRQWDNPETVEDLECNESICTMMSLLVFVLGRGSQASRALLLEE